MAQFPLWVAYILLALSLTILSIYAIAFLRFLKKSNREQYIQDLNTTVDNILKYKKNNKDMSNIVIDITDYNDIGPNIEHMSDSYLDDLASRSLIYMDDVKMWIKVNKR